MLHVKKKAEQEFYMEISSGGTWQGQNPLRASLFACEQMPIDKTVNILKLFVQKELPSRN